MNSGKRPGGLTALAVFNFIFGAVRMLSVAGLAVLMPMLGQMRQEATANLTQEQIAQLDALRDMGAGTFLTLGALSLVSGLLLLLSGIGYLQLKKLLGRTLGNAYGIIGILSALGWVVWMPAALSGGGFSIGTIIALIYPALTLILLNTAFKEDFVN